MTGKMLTFRFYEELNDFLDRDKRKKSFEHGFTGNPAIKDIIESIGVPHPEIDLIIVDGKSVGFEYQPAGGEYVSVYPVFESLDITPLLRLRPRPLRQPRFIVDVNLGRLSRWLRLCGFDTVYRNNFLDQEIAEQAVRDKRIILTRDQQLLKIKKVTHGYWVRHTLPEKQIREVLVRMDLLSWLAPFSRCMDCNGPIISVKKTEVENSVPEKTRKYYNEFYQCRECQKIYWPGSHYQSMTKKLNLIKHDLLLFHNIN